ncbi:beta-N-acetylhexosaminidase [Sphingopyxis sp. MWB1]|uniref:beta-N-acetylhexosaminidase n=1 Tax=Sphingopyxis sp. MWB1 TaxID=1537715 RepID=UPI001F40CB29|nr:family 20 glycosylhydrolase [Sphingopyxis sp. MWB1]
MLAMASAIPVGAEQRASALPLLPKPVSATPSEGGFRLSDGVAIVAASDDVGLQKAVNWLRDKLGQRAAGKDPAVTVRFERVAGLPAEGYRLVTTPRGATIRASDDAGLFHGAVTLWQLASASAAVVPAVSIEDAPRFAWRGFMLDSARHMQSVDFIKRLIDAMAAHKLNIFHWHLVDDQGWRLPIDKYPKLTEVGGWRLPATAPGAPPLPPYGGHYSKEEIRDIVAYAAARNITVVPELELPGHALAALRAYPELGTGVPIPDDVHADWGVYPWVFNIEASSFSFIDDVIAETVALFPSPYIHVGGDEVITEQWANSPRVQERMRELGLAKMEEVQPWFMRRVEAMLAKRGRKLVGWDEIAEGKLAPNATVMSWRGVEGAIIAAHAGHDAILAPSPDLYLDHRQGVEAGEGPGRGRLITLEDIYNFDPLPDSLTPEQQRHIIGLEATLFSEHARDDARASYMIFPRLSALAEVAWRGAGDDFAGFVDRLVPQVDRMKAMGFDPAKSAFTPVARIASQAERQVTLDLSVQVPAEIRYTTDGSAPGPKAQLYSQPLTLKLPARLRAAAFRGGTALPGALDRSYDRVNVLRRDDRELKQCSQGLPLALIDDAPAEGPRADFLVNILSPCWLFEAAPMDKVAAIDVEVGQVPFNFQLSNGRNVTPRSAPATPEGELEIRAGGCEGERIGWVPLAQVTSPAVTRLTVPVAPRKGKADLCFTFTGDGPDPLWAIKSVQLKAE